MTTTGIRSMSKLMNNLDVLFDTLREEGWYCGWGLPCCQSCAWGAIPDAHEEGNYMDEEIDLEKVLFNHEQDIEEEGDWEPSWDEDEDWHPRYCNSDEIDNSTFCFNGSKQGVKNLTAIIPLIEAAGCKVYWNGKGDQRPDIFWGESE